MKNKFENAYKTIGEVVKILELKSKKAKQIQPIQSGFGKLNLSKLNQKSLITKEDTILLKIQNY